MNTSAAAGPVLVGVDVGTGSARAGVFTVGGTLLATAKHDIGLVQDTADRAEQSSTEVWAAVCQAVRAAVAQAGVRPEDVAGLGLDATCSLVVLGPGGQPLPVGEATRPAHDIIVWMDHRAVEQAQRINQGQHHVLRYVGGRISPEMETPKLLWLLENRPQVFHQAWQFFDLTDFLTWRATGDLARSVCTVTCKWTYLAHEQRWDADYFRAIGLGVLADEGFARIGQRVVRPGTALGRGLSAEAAQALGLRPGTPVAAGLIDAHAGGLGTVGADGEPQDNLAYVFGTSSCTMTTTAQPVFVPGVWGPYHDAMVPGMWLNEGGQSVAGAAMDRLLQMHPLAPSARQQAQALGQSLPEWLAVQARAGLAEGSAAVHRTQGLQVVPEFLGNRAPWADPQARALVAGLGMAQDADSLVALYLAGLCGLGYGLRQIIDTQAAAGAAVKQVVVSGGAARDDLVRQLLADTTGLPVLATACEEPVLLGSAMLAAVAGGQHADVQQAMRRMSHVGRRYTPAAGDIAALHLKRYANFQRLQALAREIR